MSIMYHEHATITFDGVHRGHVSNHLLITALWTCTHQILSTSQTCLTLVDTCTTSMFQSHLLITLCIIHTCMYQPASLFVSIFWYTCMYMYSVWNFKCCVTRWVGKRHRAPRGMRKHVVCIHQAHFPSSPCSVVLWARLSRRGSESLACETRRLAQLFCLHTLWCGCSVVKLPFYFDLGFG